MDEDLTLGQYTGRCLSQLRSEACLPGLSESSLVFQCEFRSGPGWKEGEALLRVCLPAQCNVHQLRLCLCMNTSELSSSPHLLDLLDPQRFLLLYLRDGYWYEIYDNCQVLQTLGVPWTRDVAGRLTARIVVAPPPAPDTEERRSQRQDIAYLIGHDLDSTPPDRLGELSFTRRKLASPRRQELRRRDNVAYMTEPWASSVPLPRELQSYANRKIPIKLHHSQVSFTVRVLASITPSNLIAVFCRVMGDLGVTWEKTSVVLQVSGREDFLSGDTTPLHSFLWVRHCLKMSQEIHLLVVPVSELPPEAVPEEDWPLVDAFSGQSSSHQDLSLDNKDVGQILMISLWDCKRKFRVKLLGFDVPQPPSKPPAGVQVEVSLLYGSKVLASVSSAPKPFADEVLWNEWLEMDVLLSKLPRGAKLGLSIVTCPTEGPPARDQRASLAGKAKVLYFVNLLLIDHRSLLSQGPHTLHMWSYPDPDDESFAQQTDKLSCATNPDVAGAMAISFLLDRYSFPVVLPQSQGSAGHPPPPSSPRPPSRSCSPQPPSSSSNTPPPPSSNPSPHLSFHPPSSPHPLPLNHPAVSTDPKLSPDTPNSAGFTVSSSSSPTDSSDSVFPPSSLSSPTSPDSSHLLSPSSPMTSSLSSTPHPPSTTNPAPPADQTGMRKFREKSILYTSNLPQYLRRINWLEPNTVQDIHWLLGQLEASELDLSVALELLSVEFPDQRVRSLAVRRLETLSNDELMQFLLQLVQTLKVEPFHDSSLATFLVQRALRSRRIGHFFFWYVRSEVAGCPFFRQRMALVLEAYLLGCGQATLDNFIQQVKVVEALQKVASTIKRLYPDKTDLPQTAPATLQDLLRKCNLPSSFLVPFDPRVRAGTILLDRCKVMASKKKPLWLEFSPAPHHGPPLPPVGIIFKEGDDLRQDMLVLQTLVVMDSIWQHKSLDLNLVPYGCISTGLNIGMIEIVRDAVTIAAVQRSQGGTSGAFRNDALCNWLREKCPLQEIHYQAMERFVSSCAGYCVATYVLGIGDRHNDNIMITDQGNLFHIDFGHILGNRKRFLGVNRERVPFVLTPDFLYLMGKVKGGFSLNFERFKDTCMQAYLSLRSHSRLLVTLFSLMLLTGIPELSTASDVDYLRGALLEEGSEEDARKHFLRQITLCEDKGWTVQAMWWIHMVAGIK